MDQQTIIDNWYAEYREVNKIPKDQPISPTELIYFIALEKERTHVPSWKVKLVVDYVIKKLRIINDDINQKMFTEILAPMICFMFFPGNIISTC